MSSDKRKLPTRLLTREERAEKRAKITERVATESALKHAANTKIDGSFLFYDVLKQEEISKLSLSKHSPAQVG